MVVFLLFCFVIGSLGTPTCPCSTQLNVIRNWVCVCTTTARRPAWSISGCPSSLTMSTGRLSYTPSISEAGNKTCQVSDGVGSSRTLTLTVDSAYIRIACGAPSNITSSNLLYIADQSAMSAGLITFNPTITTSFCITSSTIPQQFKCDRWLIPPALNMVYTIPVPTTGTGQYEVTLHFVETYTGITGAGQRVFSATVNGVTVSNIDPFRMAGFGASAPQTFVVSPVRNSIVITVSRGVQNPEVNVIVVTPRAPSTLPSFVSTVPSIAALPFSTWQYAALATGVTSWSLGNTSDSSTVTLNTTTGLLTVRPTNLHAGKQITFTLLACNTAGCTAQNGTVRVDAALVRINVGGGPLVTNGVTWGTDPVSSGFTFTNTSLDPTNIAPAIVQVQRYTVAPTPLTYTFNAPVASSYIVQIILQEPWSGAMAPGVRVFNILIQGRLAWSGVDPFARSGSQTLILNKTIATTAPNTPITIQFNPILQNPSLAAIAIFFSDVVLPPPPPCVSPFVNDSTGACVSTATGCSAFNNQWDCRQGCVDPSRSVIYDICQGGTCIDAQCVPHTLTAFEVSSLRASIENWIVGREALEVSTPTLTGPQPGDTVGAIIRAAFHAVSTRVAEACLFVWPCTNCEFDSSHNDGLENIVVDIRSLYHSLNAWQIITMTDFVFLVTTQAVKHASNGNIDPPFMWGRTQCQCMTTFPVTNCTTAPILSMPEAEDTLSTLTNIMETQFGFTSTEWRCLIGAHAVGRAMRSASGYARHWTRTPNRLDNAYAVVLTDTTLPWGPEAGVATGPGEVQPALGKTQYHVPGESLTAGSSLMMLKADIRAFWNADGSADNCTVTHAGDGCAQLSQLSLLNTWAGNPTSFFQCFTPAFQKMVQLGQFALQTPV